MTANEEAVFSKGLEDVVAAESEICRIDGQNSKLSYRGYDIHDLAEHSHFEETVYLLLFGNLPNERELRDFKVKLAAERELPEDLVYLLEDFPKDAHPMAVLRSALSLLSFFDPEADDQGMEANVRKSIRLIARTPVIVAYWDRLRRGEEAVVPKKDPAAGVAANFLYMLKGREAKEVGARMLDKYLILLAEHDLNASTFAACITASTLSDIYSAVVSAVGTLKGDLHGSANMRSMESLLAIGDVRNVDGFVDEALLQKKKIMGFGHRVYKGPDPRAHDLHAMARTLAEAHPEEAKWFQISERLEQVVWERKKLNCNVDFYSASVLYVLGIPIDLFTPLFAASRMAGWAAHILEQVADNRLIRPVSHYVGQTNRAYTPIMNRS
ncbi:MAG: citrate synthase [Candidatus Omnitrophica bacterium]|nr:citrate synthase [Candidatus Omnitrophota bacterium]